MEVTITHCCGQKTRVIDSRPAQGAGLRRRRLCGICARRYTTLEVFAQEEDKNKLSDDMAMLTALDGPRREAIRRILEALYSAGRPHDSNDQTEIQDP
jgi:hypothetical protein